MTIDTTGKWWKGSAPDDLDEYLRALAPQEIGYSLDAFRLALLVGVRCTSCGVLSSYGDWKITYSPSLHLLEQA
jgi:hypothetical protein